MRSSGPQPNLARGARSRANLKRGGQPGRAKTTPAEKAQKKEAQKIARKLLDPTYVKNLKARLRSGKIQPGVEVAIWQYAFGKPHEELETREPIPVRIMHEYAK